MLSGLIGTKLGMTQVFAEGGDLVPVTVLEVGPCTVVQLKSIEKEGYRSVQVSFEALKEKHATKPVLGHYKKAGVSTARYLREFQSDSEEISVGQTVTAEIFQKGDFVDVRGISKGKGFQGVMKRHHFSGGPASHGSNFHRAPGSIGQSAYPSHVFKNMRMPGQMGNKRVTVQGLEVVEVRPDQNLLLVKGAVPGSRNGLVLVIKSIKHRVCRGD
ncbi:MAG: 50S ribosomal protein L3 [Nitrospiria bacterium]